MNVCRLRATVRRGLSVSDNRWIIATNIISKGCTMTRMLAILLIAVLPMTGAGAAEPGPPDQSPSEVTLPERAPDHGHRVGAAEEIYDEMLSVHARDRGTILEPYSSGTKAAVWTHHLLTVMGNHPEFTTEQRAVITDALKVLTPELFEVEQSDPRWRTVVDAPLRAITIRAQRLFSAPLARELFLDLGPREGSRQVQSDCRYPENPTAKEDQRVDLRSLRPATNDTPYCQCSTSSDYCDSSGIGLYYCKGGGCYFKSSGCGTFWQYACTGLCERREGA